MKKKNIHSHEGGGAGNTVIDYVIGDEEIREKVRNLGIKDKVDLDYHSVEVGVKGEKEEKGSKRGKRKNWRGI